MTVNLDDLLEPGETVAFRARGRSLVGVWFSGCVFFAGLFIVVLLINSRKLVENWSVDLLYVLLGGLVLTALICIAIFVAEWRGQRRSPDEVLITGRRVLFTESDWDSKVEMLILSEIERVSWSAKRGPGSLEVVGMDCTIYIPVMRQADGLAHALARATDKPRPLPIGRMASADFYMVCIYAIFGGAYFGLTSWFVARGYMPPPDLSVLSWGWKGPIFELIAIVTGLVLGGNFGQLLGKLLVAVVMRPFVTAEQMQAGLCAGERDRWQIRIALIWASLLYGRSLSYVTNGLETGSHS